LLRLGWFTIAGGIFSNMWGGLALLAALAATASRRGALAYIALSCPSLLALIGFLSAVGVILAARHDVIV
jgi:hypothetical protein